jgi:hypothetical protein
MGGSSGIGRATAAFAKKEQNCWYGMKARTMQSLTDLDAKLFLLNAMSQKCRCKSHGQKP